MQRKKIAKIGFIYLCTLFLFQYAKAEGQLKLRQSGVPYFDLTEKKGNTVYKIKDIPKLNLQEEPKVSPAEFNAQLPADKTLQLQPVKVLTSPSLLAIPEVQLQKVSEAVKKEKTEVLKMPELVLFNDVVNIPVIESKPELKSIVEIKPEEYKMIQALIFLQYKQKSDLAMSLFVELMNNPIYRNEALYHYAETANTLGLYSEFRHKMIEVTQQSKDPVLQKLAVESLVKNVTHLETSDISLIDPLVEKFDVDLTSHDQYLFKKAKYYSDIGKLGHVESSLSQITVQSEVYFESQLLKSLLHYRQGDLDSAIESLELSLSLNEKDKKNKVKNLTALTLARLYFQKNDYKSAYKNYLKIDKSSSAWLQAMVEEAWTQILAGDNEGAAGNMFSLHTDFFKKAYAPDTYIVRTVGYLNLCQYGDGVSVLSDFKKRYIDVQKKLNDFKKLAANNETYFNLVKTWLKNTTATEVDGIPRSFIVELANHPLYTTLQNQMNNYEDENLRFNKIAVDLIKKERDSRLSIAEIKSNLRSNMTKENQNKLLVLEVEHLIIQRAREGIKKMRLAAIQRLDTEKAVLKTQASLNLKNRFESITANLDHILEQNDVLSYEIYSGAGEHLRFQMAGGEIQDKPTEALSPEEQKSYKWKFKGEVWEDEIGHYRSSLKNVCAPDDIAQNQQGDL